MKKIKRTNIIIPKGSLNFSAFNSPENIATIRKMENVKVLKFDDLEHAINISLVIFELYGKIVNDLCIMLILTDELQKGLIPI